MSENEATPPEGNSADLTHETVDYQKRFTDTQAAYTKSQQELAEERRLWDDDEALAARLREKHPDWFEAEEETGYEDTDDEPATPEPKPDPRIDWLTAREAERQYDADLKEALGDETIPAKAGEWIKDRTAALGNNKKALAQAVEEFREFTGEIRGPQRRDAPTPPQAGKAGEPKYDPRDRNARRARMAASIEAAKAD